MRRCLVVLVGVTLLVAACDGESEPHQAGQPSPLPTSNEELLVTWSGPTERVTGSYVRSELCPATARLSESYELPVQITFEDGRVYWLSETVDWHPERAEWLMVDTGYRLGPLSLYVGNPESRAYTGKNELLLVDDRTPDQSYWYEILGCG